MSTQMLFSGGDVTHRDELMPRSDPKRLDLGIDARREGRPLAEQHVAALTAAILTVSLTFAPVNLMTWGSGGSATEQRVSVGEDDGGDEMAGILCGDDDLDEDELLDELAAAEAIRSLEDPEDETMPYAEARKLLGLG